MHSILLGHVWEWGIALVGSKPTNLNFLRRYFLFYKHSQISLFKFNDRPGENGASYLPITWITRPPNISTPYQGWQLVQETFQTDARKSLEFQFLLSSAPENFGSVFIALDDFRISAGRCAQKAHCNFDDGSFCNWSQDREHDDFDWVVTSSRQLQADHIIVSDHTLGKDGQGASFLAFQIKLQKAN